MVRTLCLDGMAHAFEGQITLPTSNSLPFEDRFAMLVELKAAHRNDRRLTRLLGKAPLKYGVTGKSRHPHQPRPRHEFHHKLRSRRMDRVRSAIANR